VASFALATVAGALDLVPNSHFHKRTSAPSCAIAAGAMGAAARGATGASGTGIGIMGAAEAGSMLGTSGASLCGFLSRLPILESSMLGWSAS
jgi:hypothetical protein